MQPGLPQGQGNVWPPPPTAYAPAPQSALPGLTVPFKTVFRYSEGSVPNFRVGQVNVSENGVYVQGQSAPRYEIQVPVMIACIVLGAGWLIAYLIMEYAIRNPDVVAVPWDRVKRVVCVPRNRQVCLVYDAPNYKGTVKPFSLTFPLVPGQYEAFVAAVQQYAPGKLAEGKLRNWTSPVVWVICAGILVTLVFFGLILAVGALAPPGPSSGVGTSPAGP